MAFSLQPRSFLVIRNSSYEGLEYSRFDGSIGRNCLRVIEDFAKDFRVVGLAAGNNIGLLAEQIQKFQPAVVSVSKDSSAPALLHQLRLLRGDTGPELYQASTG